MLYPITGEKEAVVAPKACFRDMPTAMRIGFTGQQSFIPDEGAVVLVRLRYLYAAKPEGEAGRRGSSVAVAIAEAGGGGGGGGASRTAGTLGGGAATHSQVTCMANVVRPSKTSPKSVDWVLPPIQRSGYWSVSCSFNGYDYTACGELRGSSQDAIIIPWDRILSPCQPNSFSRWRASVSPELTLSYRSTAYVFSRAHFVVPFHPSGRLRVHEQLPVAYVYPRKLNLRTSTDVVIGCEVPQSQVEAMNKIGATAVKVHVSGTAEGHNTSLTVLNEHQLSDHPAVELLGVEGVGGVSELAGELAGFCWGGQLAS